jgi:phage gpG-like protein
MSDSVKITVSGASEVVHRFEKLPSALDALLAKKMQALAIGLSAHVMQNKLSGQVLKTRTGNLRASINPRIMNTAGERKAIVGTNMQYAAKHEYGFSGTEKVKAHLRIIKQAFGRRLKAPVQVQVGAFSRSVNFPVRSFLRSALADYEAKIHAAMLDVAKEVANGKG